MTQGNDEAFLTTRNNELPAICPTKGHQSVEVAPSTISENAMNLQTVMRRYYPLINSYPMYACVSYTCVTVPVTPTFCPVIQDHIELYGSTTPIHPIAWFARRFTWWWGSLRYMVNFDDTAADFFAFFIPQECQMFQIMQGFSELEVQRLMTFAGTLALTHVQGSVQVEVPFQSPYEKCLIDSHQQHHDLRAQNGTLFLCFRSKVSDSGNTLPITFSLFMSTGDDFRMDVLRPPPSVYHPVLTLGGCVGTEVNRYALPLTEILKNLGDRSRKIATPHQTGFRVGDARTRPGFCIPVLRPRAKEYTVLKEVVKDGKNEVVEAEIQGIDILPKDTKMRVDKALTEVSTVINDFRESNILANVTSATENLEKLLKQVSDSAKESVGKQLAVTTAQRYAVLAAEVISAGAVLHCIRQCIESPGLGNFITLGISFGALIGIATCSSIQDMIKSVASWALDLPGQIFAPKCGRTQALDGPVAEKVEEYESTITSIVAVLGTLLFAYAFDVIPDLKKMKSSIKNFFITDAKKLELDLNVNEAQALFAGGLRNAHFSVVGFGALEKVYNKITSLVSEFLNWLLDRENPEVVLARESEQIKDRVLAVCKELDELDYEPNFVEAQKDPLVHNRFYKLMQECLDLTDHTLKHKSSPQVCVLIAECRRRATNLIKVLEKERPPDPNRYDPYVICLHGDPGVGKSYIMKHIINLIKQEMDLSDYNLVHTMNLADNFMSGYKNQPIILWDEFCQARKQDEEAIPQFMQWRSNRPTACNMASLEEKGRAFTSQAIILGTNSPYPDTDVIRSDDAFLRRRHIMLGMEFLPGFDSETLRNARVGEFEDYHHCHFYFSSPYEDNRDDIKRRERYTLEDVMGIIREDMRRWHLKQVEILRREREGAPPACLPRGVVPVVDGQAVIHDGENIWELPQQQLNFGVPEEILLEHGLENGEDNEVQGFAEFWSNFKNNRRIHTARETLSDFGFAVALTCDPASLTDEEILRAQLFIQRMQGEPASIKRRLYLQYLTRRRQGNFLYKRAKHVFQSLATKITNFITENPRIAKVLGIMALLASAGALFALGSASKSQEEGAYESGPARGIKARFKAAEGHYESGPQKSGKVRIRAAEGAYESGPQKAAKVKFLSQGSTDPVASDIRRIVHSHVYPIGWMSTASKTMSMNCVHLCGHIILAPFHFFHNAKSGDHFILLHRNEDLIVEYDPERMVRKDERDFVLYDCGPRLEPCKHIMKYFIQEKDLGTVTRFPGVLCTLDDDGERSVAFGEIDVQARFKYVDKSQGEVYVQQGWEFAYPTKRGDCGSPLIGLHTRLVAPGKVLGIHVAGLATKNKGFSVLITRDMLTELLDLLPRSSTNISEGPLPGWIEGNPVQVIRQARIIPEGDYTIIGVMPPKYTVAQPQKTSFIHTPWFDEVSTTAPPPKKPAYLKPFISAEGIRVSPLRIALSKYGKHTAPFPLANLRKCEDVLFNLLNNKLRRGACWRLFSVEEAVNGIPGIEFCERMNMKTSPGWPYQVLNKNTPGKWSYFNEDGSIADQLLQYNVTQRIDEGENLRRVQSIWRDCLKDELRPVQKVEEGKTRLFTIAPVDFTIVTRMYLMDFIISFYSNALDFFSAVGINPESFDWTRMYNKLSQQGTQTIAGDFSTFDGTIHPELIMLVCRVINRLYDDSEANQNVRTTLFIEIIHTYQLVENLVYQSHQGNPSGNPITVVLNTIVGFLYFMLSWIEITKQPLDVFLSNVTSYHYGDDNLTVVSHKFSKFNFNSIKQCLEKYGIKYTLDTKEDCKVYPDFKQLNDTTFLKRGFRQDSEFGKSFILPTMSVETLESFFYYYRKSPDENEQLRENMRASLAFAAFHGRRFYDEFHGKWTRVMGSHSLSPPCITFEEQVDVYLSTCQVSADTSPLIQRAISRLSKGQTEGWSGFEQITNSKIARAVIGLLEAPLYYATSVMPHAVKPSDHPRTDDRWAVAIPSGEGKSSLVRKFPHIFVDHDELLLKNFSPSQVLKGNSPWKHEIARKHDFPPSDRRILLVHHPDNTNRQMIGSFIKKFPTFIRYNIFDRLSLHNPTRMSRDDRNTFLLLAAKRLEPQLFQECEDLSRTPTGQADFNSVQALNRGAVERLHRPSKLRFSQCGLTLGKLPSPAVSIAKPCLPSPAGYG